MINLQWVSNEVSFVEDEQVAGALNTLIEVIRRVERELGSMELWARQQESNAFANQVRQWATAERSKLWATFDFGDNGDSTDNL